jgi:four helix bundle protein
MIYDLRLMIGGLRADSGLMNSQDLCDRTIQFALRILRLADALPKTVGGRTVSAQIARSGTSVAANYRAALRGKSRADFINKITIVLEEADETEFWLELVERSEFLPAERIRPLLEEASELVRIFNATRSTARNRKS